MRVTNKDLRKRIRKILNEGITKGQLPQASDIGDYRKARKAMPQNIKNLNMNALLGLTTSSITRYEAYRLMHALTVEEMDNDVYTAIATNVMSLTYALGSLQLRTAKNTYQSITPKPTGIRTWSALLKHKTLHAHPPGAITNYTYKPSVLGGKDPHAVAMNIYLSKATDPVNAFNLICQSGETLLSDADKVEVGFAAFLAKSGLTNVTHTAQAGGLDVTATHPALGALKFELKKSETPGDVNINFNQTPIINDSRKFYVFINPDEGLIIRSDILAIYNRIGAPLPKTPDEFAKDPDFSDVESDALLVTPDEAMLVAALGTVKHEVIKSIIQDDRLKTWWDNSMDDKGVLGVYGSENFLQKVNNKEYLRQLNQNLTVGTTLRALVQMLGLPTKVEDLVALMPNLNKAQIGAIASRMRFNRSNAPTQKNLDSYLSDSQINTLGIDATDPLATQYLGYIYDMIRNNPRFPSNHKLRKITIRIGETPLSPTATDGTTARVSVSDFKGKPEQKIVSMLKDQAISKYDKSAIVRTVLNPIDRKSGDFSIYDSMSSNEQTNFDNKLIELLNDDLNDPSFPKRRRVTIGDSRGRHFQQEDEALFPFAYIFNLALRSGEGGRGYRSHLYDLALRKKDEISNYSFIDPEIKPPSSQAMTAIQSQLQQAFPSRQPRSRSITPPVSQRFDYNVLTPARSRNIREALQEDDLGDLDLYESILKKVLYTTKKRQ